MSCFRSFSSYLHCKWATLEELEKDPRIHQKIKRFRTKQAQMKHLFTEPDEDLFNPDYVEADRILEVAVTTDTETGEEVTHYLVKWCSLSYEEATWELQEDLDPEKIKEFEEIQKLPPGLRHMERPPPEKWQKLDRSRDYRNGNQLREYQLEGMNWLMFNWYNRKNCILADEMGLGKTIQSITFLYEIFNLGIRGPFLIIAPLSTITNWEREFRTWTHMNVIVYHGSQISRQMILQYEMFYRDAQGNTVSGGLKFHGLITTFEMIMADCPELKKLQWRCVVIDEAHRLKNRNCKLLEGLKLMNLVRACVPSMKRKITENKKLKAEMTTSNADWRAIKPNLSHRSVFLCLRVLLRVRMLYYLKVEVLGEVANQAQEGVPASKLEVSLPDIDYIEIPVTWWDAEADKSLLIGVHKHGETHNLTLSLSASCNLEKICMLPIFVQAKKTKNCFMQVSAEGK
uniref:Uncharacterized protein n=1 Tax=Fundulus heteroclitus TaxID=8078 RepID=A0A3Q2QI98_FUNHE